MNINGSSRHSGTQWWYTWPRWKHPKTGIYWLRKLVPDDLRPILGKQEEKRSLGTRDVAEAKRLHVQALVELEQRWANLRVPPKPISEREAHELVAPAYERWINFHRDNPSEQTVWTAKFFDDQEMRQEDADGYCDMLTMVQFCREQVEKLLRDRGLKVDWLSRSKIEKAFGAAIQRASLDLAKLAKGEFARPPSSQPAMSVAQHRPDTVSATEPVTFETLITGWASERRPMQKTIYAYKHALGNLAAFLGHDDATRLSSQNLVAWKAKMIDAGLHPKTILDAKLAPVRAILQWAVDNDRVPFNPATRVAIRANLALGPLFPTLPPDVFGKRGGNATKVIGRWVRRLGLTDKRICRATPGGIASKP